MEKLSSFCDIIILIGATVMAIYNIINIVSKPTSKFKKKKNELRMVRWGKYGLKM